MRNEYIVSAAERRRLQALFGNLMFTQSQDSQDERALSAIERLRAEMPAGLRTFIQEAVALDQPHFLMRGLPQQGAELVHLALSMSTGQLVCHAQEGPLQLHMTPDKQAPARHVAYYTANEFFPHQEYAYLRETIDHLSLLTIRNPCKAKTLLVANDEVVARLSLADRRACCANEFRVRIPPHFGGSQGWASACPILYARDGYWEIRARFDGLQTLSANARRGAAAMKQAIHEVTKGIELPPGSLLFINNARCLHGRAAFKPTYDAGDRYVLKLYTKRDVARFGISYEPRTRRIVGF